MDGENLKLILTATVLRISCNNGSKMNVSKVRLIQFPIQFPVFP